MLVLLLTNLCFGKIYLPNDISEKFPKDQQYLVFINAIIGLVESSYIKEMSEPDIVEKILYGLFNELDPHTSYLDEETFAFLKEELNGKFGGLGIYIAPYDGFIKVMSCLEGAPAIKFLLPGDVITHVDGTFVYGMNIEKVTKMLKGKPGTNVKIKIKRKNKKLFEQTITRQIVNVPMIRTEVYNRIAYIRVALFYEGLAKDIHNTIRKLQKGKKIDGIIFDVRMNPGGILEEVISIAEMLLPKGSEVLSVKNRSLINVAKTASDPMLKSNIPVVVLIDALSASAAEILAGTLKENKRAIIVGERSYGKASVQRVVNLSEKTAIKMTVAKYYLPNNVDIQSVGVIPDFEVKAPYSDLTSFREEDLPRALKPDNTKTANKLIGKDEQEKRLSELYDKLDGSATDNKEGQIKKAKKSLDAKDFILYKKVSMSEAIKNDEQVAKAFEIIRDKIKKNRGKS